MLYDHAETLRTIALEDVTHVEKMLAKLDAYARTKGRSTLGRFLQAVVIGDLVEAVCHADDVNVKYLREYVKYVYNRLPGTHVLLAQSLFGAIRETMEMRSGPPLKREHVEAVSMVFRSGLKGKVMKEERSNAGRETEG